MGSTIVDVLTNLANQTGFASLDWKNYVMILIAFVVHVPCNRKGL